MPKTSFKDQFIAYSVLKHINCIVLGTSCLIIELNIAQKNRILLFDKRCLFFFSWISNLKMNYPYNKKEIIKHKQILNKNKDI